MILNILFYLVPMGMGGRVGPPPAANNQFTRQDDNKLDEKPRFGPAGGQAPAPGAAPPAAPAPAPPPPPPPPPVPVTQAPPPPMMPATNPPAPAPLPVTAPAPLPVLFPILPTFPPVAPPVPIQACEGIAGECKKEGELCEPGTARSDDYCPVDDQFCCSPATPFY